MTNTISRISRSLHWIIALAMIALWVMAQIMENLGETPEALKLTLTHGSIGMSVFLFGVIRLINRMREGFPEPLSVQPRSLEIIGRIVHWILLILPIAMPISGFLMFYSSGYPVSWFGIEITAGTGEPNKSLGAIGRNMHGLGGTLLMIAVVLHVGGALKHHFIDKDGTLKRMLGLGYK